MASFFHLPLHTGGIEIPFGGYYVRFHYCCIR